MIHFLRVNYFLYFDVWKCCVKLYPSKFLLNSMVLFKILLLSMMLEAPLHASGHEIYQKYCSVCHASGLAGAPKFHSKEDWQHRCQNKDLQELLTSAIRGINAMPAKGTCSTCQDSDILDAIKFMVPNASICH